MSQLKDSLQKLAKAEKQRRRAEHRTTAPAPTRVTDQTRVPSSPRTPSSPMAPTTLALQSSGSESDSGLIIDGLSGTQYCTTPARLAKVIGSIVANSFKFADTELKALQTQFCTYFRLIGWMTEDIVAAHAGKVLPAPDDLTDKVKTVDMIHPGIIMQLTFISTFLSTVRKYDSFLTKSTKLDQLAVFHRNNLSVAKPPAVTNETKATRTDKVPVFSLPKFTGERLDGEEWIKGVVRKFKGNGVFEYLTSSNKCDNNLNWSEAFASRLLDSIVSSDILNYITTELDDEGNCCDVWNTICDKLQSSDLDLARVLKHWQAFFQLRCTTLDAFPKFYSDVRAVTTKLHNAKSIAVGDDSFVKAFLSSVLDVEDLAQGAKEFLKQGNKKYNEIMDDIQIDYNTIDSTVMMRNSGQPTKSQLRRAKNNDVPPVAGTGFKSQPQQGGSIKLPPNTGNLIPNAYYLQLKGWYEASRVPVKDRSEAQINYLSAFKWKHTTDPKAKRPWNPPDRRKGEYQRNADHRSSRRARGRDRRDRSESFESYSDDSAPSYRHRSRRGRKRRTDSKDRSLSRSRSPVARRGQDGEGKPSSSKNSRRANLFTRT